MCRFPLSSPSRDASSKTLITLCLLFSSLVLTTIASAQTPAPAPKPTPDVLIFNNGDQLSGTVLRGVGDTIVFKSDMAGEITVPLNKIKELRSASSFAIVRKDLPVKKNPPQTGTIAVREGNVTVNSDASSSAPPQAIPDKELAYIVDKPTFDREIAGHQSFREGWVGSITAGASLVRATQSGTTFTAAVSAVRNTPSVAYIPRRDRTIFNLQESYGKFTQPLIPQTDPETPDSIAKTNIFHSDIEQDRYFTPRFYVLATAAFDHNFSSGLNLQQVYGAGAGWTPVDSPKQHLDLSGNVHYEKQHFQDPTTDQNLIGATVSENYLRNLPGKLVFTESASYLPAFNNSNAYSANFAAGLALPVYHRFSVSLSTSDNYLNNPSIGYRNNSYQYVTGLTYTLH
jgi:hypothetical protein